MMTIAGGIILALGILFVVAFAVSWLILFLKPKPTYKPYKQWTDPNWLEKNRHIAP